MPLVHVVIGLAVIEFFFFCSAVGRARARYDVKAPATTGNEMFERVFRVQMNTLEQLMVFIPSSLLFALYLSPYVAAALGVVFVVGRMVYFTSYVRDPQKRGPGFLLSVMPNLILMLGALVGAIRGAVRMWA
jgi:uncharacterized MAPEG superfamily protein